MSKQNLKPSSKKAPEQIEPEIAPVRIDLAHEPKKAAPPAPDLAGAEMVLPAGDSAAVASLQQVRMQASQLAMHLQRQQASVDHRESELNSRLASMENQIRSARLWLNERQSELAHKQVELDRREADLAQREAEFGDDAGARKSRGARRGSAADDAERASELDRREAEIEALATRWAQRVATAEQVEDVQELLRKIEARNENFDRAEKLLAAEQSAVERERRDLAEERIAATERMIADRQKFVEDEQRAVAERDKMREELKRQSMELGARQAALERTRADIARTQQEVLEIRLATEELWAHLCGSMPPAAVTQSLAQIRLKLADEQRAARNEIAQQKSEIQALGARVAEQHARLAQQREDFQAWALERQRDLEKQSHILVAQQQMAEKQAAEFQEERNTWQSERFRLQQEIRRLVRLLDRRSDSSLAA